MRRAKAKAKALHQMVPITVVHDTKMAPFTCSKSQEVVGKATNPVGLVLGSNRTFVLIHQILQLPTPAFDHWSLET